MIVCLEPEVSKQIQGAKIAFKAVSSHYSHGCNLQSILNFTSKRLVEYRRQTYKKEEILRVAWLGMCKDPPLELGTDWN